jgi:hypothetical protein
MLQLDLLKLGSEKFNIIIIKIIFIIINIINIEKQPLILFEV